MTQRIHQLPKASHGDGGSVLLYAFWQWLFLSQQHVSDLAAEDHLLTVAPSRNI